jgi:exodeoxyribonuclease V alpha subunit
MSTGLRLRNAACQALLEPFVSSELLTLGDAAAAAQLGELAGAVSPLVVLACAFALRAPRFGHAGVNVLAVRELVLADETSPSQGGHTQSGQRLRAEARVASLRWPDPAEWLQAVRAAPSLVARAPASDRPFVLHADVLMTQRNWRFQDAVAVSLLARAERPVLPPHPGLRAYVERLFPPGPAHGGLFGEPDLQALAALSVVLRPLCVITGGPGTGKTHTIKNALALLATQHLLSGAALPRVALAAPTGKAAVRMKAALGEGLHDMPVEPEVKRWLSGLEPSTIHRLLGIGPDHSGRSRYHVGHPLPAEVVVVDEASMVDVALFAKLVLAVAPSTRLVFLGDPHQLASVEAGSALLDLVGSASGPAPAEVQQAFASAGVAGLRPPAAGQPPGAANSPLRGTVVKLERVHRTASGSGPNEVARALASGTPEGRRCAVAWLWGERMGHKGPFDSLVCHPLEPGVAGLPAEASQALVESYLPLYSRIAGLAQEGFTDEVVAELLAAQEAFRVLTAHRQGAFGVEGLNDAIGAALGRLTGLPTRRERWWGRPILVLANDPISGRMNGDTGLLVPGPHGVRAAFAQPGRSAPSYTEWSALPPFETVFAMTVHKSQGSQFDHAALVVSPHPSRVLTRELIYTALTRAKRRITMVGERSVIAAALEHTVQRASTLALRLEEGAGGG